MQIITNNERVADYFGDTCDVLLLPGSFRDVLVEARDRIHRGQKLLTHPLMGSVKPNETPFKSVALDSREGELDMESLILIENSIAAFDKFARMRRPNLGENAPEDLKNDFREIDLSLIVSGLRDHLS